MRRLLAEDAGEMQSYFWSAGDLVACWPADSSYRAPTPGSVPAASRAAKSRRNRNCREIFAAEEIQVGKGSVVVLSCKSLTVSVAVLPAVDGESPEMIVFPPHRDLDDLMQLHQEGTVVYQQSPPDHGADLAQDDLQLVDSCQRS